MPLTSIKANCEVVKYLWNKNIHNAKEISNWTGVPLRSCERYVAILRKNGNIPEIHRSGRPRKLTPVKRQHIGMIIKHDHFTTVGELKVILEENDSELEIGETTIRRELSRLSYVAVLPWKVPLLTQKAKDIRLS